MIQHIGEVLAVIGAAFAAGSIIGWIAYRWIDRTDYAFDQRDLSDRIGRFFGIRTPPPAEEPVAAVRAPAAAAPAVAAIPVRARRERDVRPEKRTEPRPEPVRASPIEPIVLPEPLPEPVRPEPVAAKSEAAEDLRKRVQSSSRALAWREARDERLRPGESAAQAIGGDASARDDAAAAPTADDRGNGRDAPADGHGRTPAPPRPAIDDAPDHDEPWAAAPAVWPMDLHQLPAPNGRLGLLALPSPAPSEIRLALPPVATPALAADDIWSDEAAPGEEPAAPSAPPPAAEDRPPALDGAPADRDNLRRIKGIGQGFEKRLNQLGIYRYAQIAAWTEKQQAWVSAELGFPGRVERDDWPVQAGRLAKGTDARAGSQTQIVRDP